MRSRTRSAALCRIRPGDPLQSIAERVDREPGTEQGLDLRELDRKRPRETEHRRRVRMAPVDVDQDLAEAGSNGARRASERVGPDAHEPFQREGSSESEVDGARGSRSGPVRTRSPIADLQPFALAVRQADPFQLREPGDRAGELDRSLQAGDDPIQNFGESHTRSVRSFSTRSTSNGRAQRLVRYGSGTRAAQSPRIPRHLLRGKISRRSSRIATPSGLALVCTGMARALPGRAHHGRPDVIPRTRPDLSSR